MSVSSRVVRRQFSLWCGVLLVGFLATPGGALGVVRDRAEGDLSWIGKLTPDLRSSLPAPGEELDVLVVLHVPDGERAASEREIATPLRLLHIRETGDELAREYEPFGVHVRERTAYLPLLHLRIPAEMLEALAADARVVSIEPVRTLQIQRQNAKTLIGVPPLAAMGLDGSGVSIAVLDSGVDYRHPELAPGGTGSDAKTVKLWDAIGNDDDPMDENSHGTAVAGIIAGATDGMAPAARIVAVRVMNASGNSEGSSIVVGLDKVIESVVGGNPHNIRVVNLSLGGLHATYWPPNQGTCDDLVPSYKRAFDTLTNLGVLVVVSAGNDGCSNGVAIPACVSSALAVGAVYNTNRASRGYVASCGPNGECYDAPADRGKIACFSNSGDKLGVWAPSASTVTPTWQRPGMQPGVMEYNFGGTSAAAPYVAGVAALLAAAEPGAGARSLRHALTTTGEAITDSRNSINRNLIDGEHALARLREGCDAGEAPSWLAAHPGTVCKNQTFTLSWPAVEGAASYTVEIAETWGFEDSTMFEATGTSLGLRNDDSVPVTFLARVRANVECGSSAWSNVMTMRYVPECGQTSGSTARRRLGAGSR